MTSGLKPWREAASLIVLASRQTPGVAATRTNYDILFQKRVNTASSFPSSIVFPGGVTEVSDFSQKWLEYILSCGVTKDRLYSLSTKGSLRSPIFHGDPIKRHIGLRITAIREVFEELGVLICTHTHDSKNINKSWASTISNFDVKDWQLKVHNNAEEFLQLCRHLDCYPNIWALHYWNNWLTPSTFKNRFDTAFFVTAFHEKPEIAFEESEVAAFRWASPENVLERSTRREIDLLPPQQYELLRMVRHSDLDELVQYAAESDASSKEVYSPTHIFAKDGTVFILPGDDMYPKEMDHTQKYEQEMKTLTLEELRRFCTKLNRFEKTKNTWELISNLQN